MMLYIVLKNVHIVCVVITGLLFAGRFYLLQRYSHMPLHPALRTVPHINDTILLSAAIGMVLILGINPFTVTWLLAKLVLLVIYIGLGVCCMRSTPGSRAQIVYFVLAVFVYLSIVGVALDKGAVVSS